jgi:hypothetical protein
LNHNLNHFLKTEKKRENIKLKKLSKFKKKLYCIFSFNLKSSFRILLDFFI